MHSLQKCDHSVAVIFVDVLIAGIGKIIGEELSYNIPAHSEIY